MTSWKIRTRHLGAPPMIPEVCQDAGVPGRVSILIPTFNRAKIIGPTLASVLAQTYEDVEIIVVDDGSRDETRAVVESYGPRIRYIWQPNAGLAAARNTGLCVATGEFIAFQDSDDLFRPWKITAQVAAMRAHPDAVLSWTDMAAIDPAGRLVRPRHLRTMYSVYRQPSLERNLRLVGTLGDITQDVPQEHLSADIRKGDISDLMALGNLVHPPTVLMRREFIRRIGGLDSTFAWTCEDYEFFWRLSRHGAGLLVDAPSMLYRVDAPDQLTRPELALYQARGNYFALWRHLDLAGARIGRMPPGLTAEEIRSHVAYSYSWVGREELLSDDGERSNAFRYLWSSARLAPGQFHQWHLLAAAALLPRSLFAQGRKLKNSLQRRMADA